MGSFNLGHSWRNFPLVIRGRASGLASSFNWIGSFLVGLLFPVMTASMSQEAVFAIFGVICLLGVVFIRTRVPETRGRSLEEIEKWRNKRVDGKARK
ncbi:MFS transporter [Bacillus licheniformis]|nr:MFS transporter [Bacillus licheniformis]